MLLEVRLRREEACSALGHCPVLGLCSGSVAPCACFPVWEMQGWKRSFRHFLMEPAGLYSKLTLKSKMEAVLLLGPRSWAHIAPSSVGSLMRGWGNA